MARQIPDGSVEIQTGLWLYAETKTISGNTYTFRELFSAEGYCFYDIEQGENYDEDGNLRPPAERMYAQYAALALCIDTVEKINAKYFSVPVEEGYEIVSKPNDHETI